MRRHQTAVGRDLLLLKQLGRMRSPHLDGAEPQLRVDVLMNFMESKLQSLDLLLILFFFQNVALLKPGAVNRRAHTAITAALFHNPPPPSIVYALIQFSALWFSQQTDRRADRQLEGSGSRQTLLNKGGGAERLLTARLSPRQHWPITRQHRPALSASNDLHPCTEGSRLITRRPDHKAFLMTVFVSESMRLCKKCCCFLLLCCCCAAGRRCGRPKETFHPIFCVAVCFSSLHQKLLSLMDGWKEGRT